MRYLIVGGELTVASLALERPVGKSVDLDSENQFAFQSRATLFAEYLLLSLIACAALTLRLMYVDARSLWYDESSSWQTASFPTLELLESLKLNVHLPAYFLALKAWMAMFGDSVVALRSLSIVCGLLTVLGMYLVAAECTRSVPYLASSRRAFALVAAAIVATNPFQIHASIETRMYALGTALTAFCAWAALKLLAAPTDRRWWSLFTLLSVGLLYTHHYGIFTVASSFAFLAGSCAADAFRGNAVAWPAVRRLVLAALIVCIAYIPGLLLLLGQFGRVRQDYWTVPLTVDLVSKTFLEFVLPVNNLSNRVGWGLLSMAFFACVCACIARRAHRVEAFVLVSAILPMIFAGVLSLRSPVWEGRFFRFAELFYLLALPLAIWRLCPRRFFRNCVSSAVVALMFVFGCAFWVLRDIPHRPGMRGAIEQLLTEHNGRDLIVVNSNVHYFPAKFYLPKHVNVKMLASSNNQFWGGHLIREEDLLDARDFKQALNEGVWFIDHSGNIDRTPDLQGAVVDRQFSKDYDHGVPHWSVHVQHVTKPDDEWRVSEAIKRVEHGVSTELDFSGIPLSAETIDRIAALSNLKGLILNGTSLDDSQLTQLAHCSSLVSVSLVNTGITDSGLKSLGALQKLSSLSLDFTAISDASLSALPSGITSLSLRGTIIGDKCIRQLGHLTMLEQLDLGQSKVGDAIVDELIDLRTLRKVSLDLTQVSRAAAEQLRRERPDVTVEGTQ